MKQRLIVVLQAGGLVLLSLAAWTVSVGVGLAAFGASAVLFGVALERE